MKESLALDHKPHALHTIPSAANGKCACITHEGITVLMDVKHLEKGTYRTEFLEKTGVALPPLDLPEEVPHRFAPFITDQKEVEVESRL